MEKDNSQEISHLMAEIHATLNNISKNGIDIGDLKLLNTTLKELYEGHVVFSPYKDKRKVVVFGSARSSQTSPAYLMTEEFSRKISQKDFMVITGGGPGLMEAANKGAGKENSFGINIKLPYEQIFNKYIDYEHKAIFFKYFFTRKLMFIKESHATVIFPGGFGTLNEAIENINLIQTGKCAPRPVVLIEPKGSKYWNHWLSAIRKTLLNQGYIGTSDFNLFTYTTDVDVAVETVINFYKNYHSIKRVEHLTALRLINPLSDEHFLKIKNDFKDLFVNGNVRQGNALPEEREFLELPRLIFEMKEKHYGMLLQMIREINREVHGR